jgi:hypothetical protein
MKQGDIQLLAGLSSRAVVGWGKHSVRLDTLTKRHVQELRQILIVRADNFFVDDAR